MKSGTKLSKLQAAILAGASVTEAKEKVGCNPAQYYYWKKKLATATSDTPEQRLQKVIIAAPRETKNDQKITALMAIIRNQQTLIDQFMA